MKSIRKFIVVLVMVMAAALVVVPAFAQDNSTPTPTPGTSTTPHRPFGGSSNQNGTRTITVTQEQINTRLANRKGDRLKDLSISLGDGQVTVSFTTNGEKNNGVGRAVVAVVTPGTVDGKLSWTFNSLTIDGKAATQQQMDNLKDKVTSFMSKHLENRERHFSITSVTVDSSAITVTLTRIKTV